MGESTAWDRAETVIRRVLEATGKPFEVDQGGGAFYGPKIDLKVNDALGREWQLSTIQVDFNLPERFALEFIGEDGQPHRPYMVHRALLGAVERFFGVLIEHYGGAFPVWLAPVQAAVIPVSAERHGAYAQKVANRLRVAGVRVELSGGKDRMQARIREAQLQKIPYMLIVGDREREADAVAVRLRTGEDLGGMPVQDFIARIQTEGRVL
jgi:threonyl-tRNA synthetase